MFEEVSSFVIETSQNVVYMLYSFRALAVNNSLHTSQRCQFQNGLGTFNHPFVNCYQEETNLQLLVIKAFVAP